MLKKLVCLLLALMLASMTFALAEDDAILRRLEGLEFEFSSGAGGWSTELSIGADGAFTGNYHDSEMGEDGEDYPYGTLYGCLFHGAFSAPEQIDEYTWKLPVASLEKDEGQLDEAIEDGIRYVTTDPYGLFTAREVVLYLPGAPVDALPEGFLIWSHLNEIDPHAEALPYYAIWNEEEDAGFITLPLEEEQARLLGIANPWKQVTAEEMKAACGAAFGVPEDVYGEEYFLLNGGELAEMQFYRDGVHYVARIRTTEAFTDISGMYYAWNSLSAMNLGGCPGVVWGAEDEGASVLLCLWYDSAHQAMYSLSARAYGVLRTEELLSAANAVYIPLTDAE